MAYLAAITAGGGVPLFTRTVGSLPPLNFAAVGSLYGIYTFVARSVKGARLVSTDTSTAKVVWRCFNDSVILALITPNDGAPDAHRLNFLDYVFAALVLLLGAEELGKNVKADFVRRALRNNFVLLDRILQERHHIGPRLRSVEVCVCADRPSLQCTLDNFALAANCAYGCLLIKGRPVVCTDSWWSLTTVESGVLFAYMRSLQPCTARDLPVFLPDASPSVPLRLVTVELTPGMTVCLLCGPEPTLGELLDKHLEKHWGSALESLTATTQSLSKAATLPVTGLDLDRGLMGLILADRSTARCLFCVLPAPPAEEETTGSTRRGSFHSLGAEPPVADVRAALVHWYFTVVGDVFPLPDPDVQPHDEDDAGPGETPPPSPGPTPAETSIHLDVADDHEATETYLVAEAGAFYAMQKDEHALFAMYSPTVPTYALRSVTSATFDKLKTAGLLP